MLILLYCCVVSLVSVTVIGWYCMCKYFSFSPKFSFDAHLLKVTVDSETNDDPQFGPTSYIVTFKHAPGGRLGGKGRKDKLGCDVFCTCSCKSYEIHGMCKHIGAICVVHLS